MISVLTDDDLDLAALTALKRNNLIIDMSMEYSIGADVKFKSDAKIVIVADNLMNQEDLIQCLARGSCAMGTYKGTHFYKANPLFKDSVIENYEKPAKHDFKEAADIVRILRSYCDANKRPISRTAITTTNESCLVGLYESFFDV